MRLRVILTALAMLAASAAFAQAPADRYAGRPIRDVLVFIEREPTADAALLELVETRQGQTLSMASVRETITHFFSLGRFQDIQVEALDAPDGGVTLHYNLIPVHAVERVEFRNQLGLSERQLRNAVEERFGRSPQLGRAAEVTRVLERLYEDHGYFRASIRAVPTTLEDPHRTILTFEIDSGPRANVRTIDIVGDAGLARQDLLARLRLVEGRPYDRLALQDRLTEYTNWLKGRGHLQAAVSHTPRLSEDGRTADITLDVQAGPVVEVRFEGDPLPRDQRADLAPFQREGSVDEDLIEDSVQRIRQYLHQQGYWKADVTADSTQADNTLTIVLTVRKGPLYRVAKDGVDVTGNVAIALEEIRPLIVLAPGAPYVASHLDVAAGAILRLYRTRGFAWVEVKTAENDVSASAGGEPVVRPAIVINEGPRAVIGEIRVTGVEGLSEADILRVIKLQPGSP
ncbi:MAG: POTRA domain-containing protein, partial [Vicinamibacterales bacterium]